jgi:hypothetical protein
LYGRWFASVSFFVVFCVLLVGAATVSAQSKWVVGAKGGLNSEKTEYTGILGAFAGKEFSDRFGMRVEVLYTKDYFETPLLITVNTTKGKSATFHVFAGIAALFASSDGDGSTDVGGVAGIGVKRPVGRVEIVADARLTIVSSEFLDSFGDSVFSLMVGVGIPLPLE